MLTDTHCHLDLEKFDADRAEVLVRARAAGVTRILIPGLDLPSSRRIVKLAESDPLLFAAIGVHPTNALTWDTNTKDGLRTLALNTNVTLSRPSAKGLANAGGDSSFPSVTQNDTQKIVAIGEIGLDYYWDSAPHDVQQYVLQEQLALAAELRLPVVIHLREKGDAEDGDCASDLMQIIEAWVNTLRVERSALAEKPGVLHSFGGSKSTAEKAIDLNFYIGMTGPVTYRNAHAKREVVKSIPLERLLIETDAPFLAPVPQRGKRNEPAFVQHIADKIAEIHHLNPDEVADMTTRNAARLFSW